MRFSSREKAIRSPDGHVQDQVEFLIERSIRLPSLAPRVVKRRVVYNVLSELTPVPHVFAPRKGDKEDLLSEDAQVSLYLSITAVRVHLPGVDC